MTEWLAPDPCWERVITFMAIGAALGGACVFAVNFALNLDRGPFTAFLGGSGAAWLIGVPLGALLSPTLWPLLRRVSVRRAILWCCSGTILGSLVGFAMLYAIEAVTGEEYIGGGMVGGGVLGLFVAASAVWATEPGRTDAENGASLSQQRTNNVKRVWIAILSIIALLSIWFGVFRPPSRVIARWPQEDARATRYFAEYQGLAASYATQLRSPDGRYTAAQGEVHHWRGNDATIQISGDRDEDIRWIVSIGESDHGSGWSHGIMWSKDSKALLIGGRGALWRQKPTALCLVYLIDDDVLVKSERCGA